MRVTKINTDTLGPKVSGTVEALSGLSELTSVKIAGTGSNGNLEVLLSACPKLTELGMESTRTTGRVDNIARLVYAHMEHGLST